ncbi:MAG: hypothetical protein SGI71_06090, partial [Verrucomicrobiota bacterium]|nr:hypothetical protein [Verrucomicrobiota bacterium]
MSIFTRLLIWFSVGFLALILFTRLTSLVPNIFTPVTLLFPVILALGVAAILASRKNLGKSDAAREVDRHGKTKDLFLTSVLVGPASGAFYPLISAEADIKAYQVDPRKVVMLDFKPLLKVALCFLIILIPTILFTPQLDPFGRNKERKKVAEAREKIDEQKKAIELRQSLLKKKDVDAPNSKLVAQNLEELLKTLKQLKPQEKNDNLKKLNEQQKNIGGLWRDMNAEKQAGTNRDFNGAQNFGEMNKSAQDMQKQMQNGDASQVKKELQDLKALAEKLGQAKSAEEREKLVAEMQKRLKSLEQMTQGDKGAAGMQSALKKAMENLQASQTNDGALSNETLQALKESLGLSQLEAEQLAQNSRDMKSLEEALKAMQMAKQLNDKGNLPGEGEGQGPGQGQGSGKGLSDYAALYEKLMREG